MASGFSPSRCEPPADQPRLADEAGVEQHGVALRVHQQVADAHDAADGVDAGIAHAPGSVVARCGAKLWRGSYPNALNVMIVRVSWMPGMTCTFSLMKWPMSVASST